jgi:DNA-binding CsgD family transcriptional regulator
MTVTAPVEGRRPPAVPPQDLHFLLRQLVGACPDSAQVGTTDVLLDVEIGGFRYLVVRKALTDPDDAILLSPREQEIARLVSKGYVNKTIARILDISGYTVDTYIRRLFAKLNVATRAAMVAKMLEAGILKEDGTRPR